MCRRKQTRSRSQRCSTGSVDALSGASKTMNLTFCHSSDVLPCPARQILDAYSNRPRPIQSSPSRTISRGKVCKNHGGAFHTCPFRDQRWRPSHHARTPSSFSLIHQPVGSFCMRSVVSSRLLGQAFASKRGTRVFRCALRSGDNPVEKEAGLCRFIGASQSSSASSDKDELSGFEGVRLVGVSADGMSEEDLGLLFVGVRRSMTEPASGSGCVRTRSYSSPNTSIKCSQVL